MNDGERGPRWFGSRNPWLVLSITVSAVLAVLALFNAFGGAGPADDGSRGVGRAPSSAPAPAGIVPVDRLSSVVLSPAEVSGILADPALQAENLKQVMDQPTYRLSNPDCFSALRAVSAPAYEGSGWTGVRAQYFADPGSSVDHEARQGVVAYPSAAEAAALVADSAAKWASCAGQTVTAEAAGTTQQVTIGDVEGAPPKVSVRSTVAESPDRVCQRVLRAVTNVVIDVGVCGVGLTDEASRIVTQIALNVDRVS